MNKKILFFVRYIGICSCIVKMERIKDLFRYFKCQTERYLNALSLENRRKKPSEYFRPTWENWEQYFWTKYALGIFFIQEIKDMSLIRGTSFKECGNFTTSVFWRISIWYVLTNVFAVIFCQMLTPISVLYL